MSEEAADYQSDTALPSYYNLRDYGRVGAIKNQGSYNTCWVFAALGSIESTMIEQFTDIDFSVRHLAWSSYVGEAQDEFYGKSSGYMDFGNEIIGIGTLAAWSGLAYTSDYPYNLDYEITESDRSVSEYHLQDAYVIYQQANDEPYSDAPNGSVQMIKELIMEYGALSVNYNVGTGFYQPDYNAETNAFYCEKTIPNHGVLLVGWDDDFSRENFCEEQQPEHDGAWLIKNSYGDGFFDDGYVWVSYDTPSLYANEVALVEDSDNYQTNYQYDLSWMFSVTADDFVDESKASRTAYISSIFTAESDEVPEAVSFYTTDFNAEYEISVYTGVDENETPSGTLAYSGQSGTEKYAGYHTIELNEAVALNGGERFGVVVRLKNPDHAYPIAADGCTAKSDGTVKSGETFYSKDGSSWNDIVDMNSHNANAADITDLVTVADVCLKAFTNPMPQSGEAVANVDFSILEGPVALGSELELSNSENIHYLLTYDDGTQSEVMTYAEPIVLNEPCAVTAWGEKDGKEGNRTSKTYTKAQLKLIDLYYTDENGNHTSVDVSGAETETNIAVGTDIQKLVFRARGTDTITIDGVEVKSDEWSEYIEIPDGGKITDLEPGTEYTYYVRASATSSAFASNSKQVTFKTKTDSEAADVKVYYMAYGEIKYSENYCLSIGEHTIEVNAEELADDGYALAEGEDTAKTVTVSTVDGKAAADTETVIFNFDIGTPIEDFTYTVQYWDDETGEYISESTYSFENLNKLQPDDVPVLDGYERVRIDGRSSTDKTYATQLLYNEAAGKWEAAVSPVYMVVKKADGTETTTEPTAEPTTYSTAEPTTEPTTDSTAEPTTEPTTTEPTTTEPTTTEPATTDPALTLMLGDVNGDGKVDITDATVIQKFIAKIIAEFPAEK